MLNREDAIALAQVAQAAGIDPSRLKAQNPFDPAFSTPTGSTFRIAIEALRPDLAARLKAAAGHIDSIPSLAYLAASEQELSAATGELRSEVNRFRPDLAEQQQAAKEEALLASWDAAANEMAARRGADLNAKAYTGRWADWERERDRQLAADRAVAAEAKEKAEAEAKAKAQAEAQTQTEAASADTQA